MKAAKIRRIRQRKRHESSGGKTSCGGGKINGIWWHQQRHKSIGVMAWRKKINRSKA